MLPYTQGIGALSRIQFLVVYTRTTRYLYLYTWWYIHTLGNLLTFTDVQTHGSERTASVIEPIMNFEGSAAAAAAAASWLPRSRKSYHGKLSGQADDTRASNTDSITRNSRV